jgi:catechol 2,3-dioxygenase-like lactoylglutathione lyase family enzyme
MLSPSSTAFPFRPALEPIVVDGIDYVALAVADVERAATFYCELLGFAPDRSSQLPHAGDHAVVQAKSGQRVVLCRAPGDKPPDMGRHTAYGVSPHARESIVERIMRAGVAVHDYQEDRNAERSENCYFYDPDENRVQFIRTTAFGEERGAGVSSIDHVGIQAVDLEWEEDLYVGLLGLPVTDLVGWRTEDYKRAVRWGEGQQDMAPGTRRWDKRYSTAFGRSPTIARPNMQLFVSTGAQTLGIFLDYAFYQLPPEEQIIGVPRIGLTVAERELAAIEERFTHAKLLSDGPHWHPPASPYAASLYARDRGGNFLDFCVKR